MNLVPSPNFNARAPGIALDYIVLHYTGMKTFGDALERLTNTEAQVSAHYIIDEDGTVTQLVDEHERAWHAGLSSWQGITDINSASIGIELVNPGHEFGYRPFPVAQIVMLKKLLSEIIGRHAMKPLRCLLAHSDIAPTRRQDPGEHFPWQSLAKDGFGLWPEARAYTPVEDKEVVALLAQIGYDISEPRAALAAFQRRYYPETMTGEADKVTVTRLKTLSLMIAD